MGRDGLQMLSTVHAYAPWQETYVEQFRRVLEAKNAWNEEEHGRELDQRFMIFTMLTSLTLHSLMNITCSRLLYSTPVHASKDL